MFNLAIFVTYVSEIRELIWLAIRLQKSEKYDDISTDMTGGHPVFVAFLDPL